MPVGMGVLTNLRASTVSSSPPTGAQQAFLLFLFLLFAGATAVTAMSNSTERSFFKK